MFFVVLRAACFLGCRLALVCLNWPRFALLLLMFFVFLCVCNCRAFMWFNIFFSLLWFVHCGVVVGVCSE